MLKITMIETPGRRRLVLEGKLVEPWVTELRRTWEDVRKGLEGRRLVIDLRSVTAVSKEGEDALSMMMSDGAEFDCCGVLNRYVIHRLLRTSKAKLPKR